MHTLDIDISDTLSPSTFRVTDNSSMDCNLPVEGGLLEVFAPTFTEGIIMRVEPHFSVVFNCANLKMCTPGCDPLPTLPDGTYRVHYSVAPNSYVYIDYIYFRVFRLMIQYRNLKYILYKEKCSILHSEFDSRRKELIVIKDLIDASKYSAEDNQDLEMAYNLYSEAKTLLDRC